MTQGVSLEGSRGGVVGEEDVLRGRWRVCSSGRGVWLREMGGVFIVLSVVEGRSVMGYLLLEAGVRAREWRKWGYPTTVS